MVGRLTALLCLLPLSPGLAHDCWLEPARARLEPGESVTVHRLTGHDLEGKPWLLTRETTGSFLHLSAAGVVDLVPSIAWVGSVEGATLRSLAAGTHVVVFQVAPRRREMKGPSFQALLEEECLLALRQAREEAGEAGAATRVVFRRAMKTIFQVGPASDEAWKQDCGAPLDLWPERCPATLGKGERLTVRLRLRGAPVAGAVIAARSRTLGRHHPAQRVTTDADGAATFELGATGEWLLSSAWAVRARDDPEADHEVHFASLTFSLPR